MSKEVPLVLSSAGELQQLQGADKLSDKATGLASQEDFEELRTNFRLLCLWFLNQGFELPAQLVRESDLL